MSSLIPTAASRHRTGLKTVRIYAGPKKHNWYPDRKWRWNEPQLEDVSKLWAAGRWTGKCEFAGGCERETVASWFDDVWEGDGTRHLFSMQLPTTAVDPCVAPWMNVKALEGRPIPGVPVGATVQYNNLYVDGSNTIHLHHTPLAAGIKTKIILQGSRLFRSHIDLSVRLPDGYSLMQIPDGPLYVVQEGTGLIVFQFQHILNAVSGYMEPHERPPEQINNNVGRVWYTGQQNGPYRIVKLAWDGAWDWVDEQLQQHGVVIIDPTVIAGAQSGTVDCISDPPSWANCRAGTGIKTVQANSILDAYAHYTVIDELVGWIGARGFSRFDTSAVGAVAGATWNAKTYSLEDDGGDLTLRHESTDYETLGPEDYGLGDTTEDSFAPAAVDEWNAVTLDPDNINSAGHTCYILVETDHDMADVDPNDQAGAETWYGATMYGPDTAGSEPYLDITEDTIDCDVDGDTCLEEIAWCVIDWINSQFVCIDPLLKTQQCVEITLQEIADILNGPCFTLTDVPAILEDFIDQFKTGGSWLDMSNDEALDVLNRSLKHSAVIADEANCGATVYATVSGFGSDYNMANGEFELTHLDNGGAALDPGACNSATCWAQHGEGPYTTSPSGPNQYFVIRWWEDASYYNVRICVDDNCVFSTFDWIDFRRLKTSGKFGAYDYVNHYDSGPSYVTNAGERWGNGTMNTDDYTLTIAAGASE